MIIIKRLLWLVPVLFYMHVFNAVGLELHKKGFVYLHEIDPTIQISLRYFGTENFMGVHAQGYHKPVVIMTRAAAYALHKVQQDLLQDGFCLVIYDAYRPQQAIDHFVRWGKDISDQSQKNNYYPRINKDDVFKLKYVAKRSGHSRGSVVDVTIIKKDQKVQPVKSVARTLLDGFTIAFLDDGTIDMGSSFDLFDLASHYDSALIAPEYKRMRAYLRMAMSKHGFRGCSQEWWHFTLIDEPYPADKNEHYFNFVIE